MKIRTEVNDIASRPSQLKSNPQKIQAYHEKNAESANNSIRERLGAEKGLGDALSLVLVSQSIIQKALVITSQLKNMASQALNTGKINQNEVSRMQSEINSSIRDFGHAVTIPVQSGNPYGITDLKDSMDGLKGISSKIGSGDMPSAEEITKVSNGLKSKFESLIKSEKSLNHSIIGSVDFAPAKINDAGTAIEDLKSRITDNPSGALAAQGNINRENASRIASI
ncbi:MAG: hypothetical protein MUD12_01415 [Spirochaetes bacterium]|nr:hypothetical protein [Spirochaetota bacterium]